MTNEITTYEQLKKVAREINERHELILQLAQKSFAIGDQGLTEAILNGNRLIEIKEICGHGHFRKWCDENLSFAQSTVTIYMRTARDAHKLVTAKSRTQAYMELGILRDDEHDQSENQNANSISILEATPKPFYKFSRIKILKHAKSKPVSEWDHVDALEFNEWYKSEIEPLAKIHSELHSRTFVIDIK